MTLKEVKPGATVKVEKSQVKAQSNAGSWKWDLQKALKYLSAK